MAAQEPDAETFLGNILLLDKSTQPLALQIREACQLLGVHGPVVSGFSQEQKTSLRKGPREEWTLRWLLKKLERSEGCLNVELWELFRELVTRLPLANLARLLRDHGFLGILLTTLRSFPEIVDYPNKKRYQESNDGQCYTSVKPSAAANTSSTTVGSPFETSWPSKEREPEETMFSRHAALSESESRFHDIYRLVSSILRQLQGLTREDSHGYAVEHLKMALKASPEQATELLGTSFSIINYTLQSVVNGLGRVHGDFFKRFIGPWVEIWTSRSKRPGEASVEFDFAARCLIPALEVLTTLTQPTASTEDLAWINSTIDALLLQHVILPARDSFEVSRKPRSAIDDENTIIEIKKLLAPLREHNFTSVHQNPSRLEDTPSVHPIALLYGIIIKHTPLSTSKQRSANKPWLQFMFDHLLKQDSDLPNIPSNKSTLSQGFALATKQMLEILARSGMSPGTATLDRVLTQVSHILDETSDRINWDIVGLCLRIDPDVFVVPYVSGLASHSATRSPNRLLAALFARLSRTTEPSQEASTESITELVRSVLVPLVNGFAHARDLTGFVNYWRSNMIQYDKIATGSSTPRTNIYISPESSSLTKAAQCIWEHESLLQAVADQVELRLTIGQLEAVLHGARDALKSARKTSDPDSRSIFSANLVILDCMLSGCTNENTISKLSIAVQDTYVAMLRLRDAEGLPLAQRWRVWRCVATIKDRWNPEFNPEPEVHELEEQAAADALEILKGVNPDDDVNERLHCFNFLLSILKSADLSFHEELAEYTVEHVLKLLDVCAELLISQQSDFAPNTPESLGAILATQKSTLLYASLLCNRTTALGTVKQELQKHFVERVFECDLLDLRRISGHIKPPFKLSTPWKDLLHWSLFEQTNSLSDTFRSFLLDKLWKSAYWRKQSCVSEGAIYASAFENIHQAPTNAFNRKQKSWIFNHVSKTLLQNMPMGSQQLKDHVKLLIRFLAHPNKAFNLLEFPTGLPNESQAQADEDDVKEPTLLSVAELMNHRLDPYWKDTDAVNLLKLLTCNVLNYQLSLDVETQTVLYLASYYRGIACYIKKVTTSSETNSTQQGHRGKKEDDDGDAYYQDERRAEFNICSIAVIAGSLDFYRRHISNFPAALQNKMQELPPLHELRAPILTVLCDWINWGRSEFTKPISEVCQAALEQAVFNICRAAVAQELVATYADSFLGQPLDSSINDCVEDLATKASEGTQITRLGSEDVSALKQASQLLRRARHLLAARYEIGPLEAYRKFGDKENSILEQKQLIMTVMDSMKDLNKEEIAESVTALVSTGNGAILDRNDLLLLQSFLIRLIQRNIQSSEDTSVLLSSIVTGLCDALLQVQPFHVSVMSLQCINIILHKQPRTINQWHIDRIMTVIATSASRHPSPTDYTSKQSGLEYLALCRVLSTILAFHRKRLGGRYHLILPVVRSLLRPLFVPYRVDSLVSPRIYAATQASAYSRLLLQIADPALSSVTNQSRKKRKHQDLNDATKVAKSMAGQHLHYLIMTYCDCQLKGRLTQEVREKLRPGLWAVLDVIPQEVMRVMNEAMDKAGRGVWKGLYEEWRRDGHGGGRSG